MQDTEDGLVGACDDDINLRENDDQTQKYVKFQGTDQDEQSIASAQNISYRYQEQTTIHDLMREVEEIQREQVTK